MSPTTRVAHLDHLSPVEDLDLDEVGVLMSKEKQEIPKTTTIVETSGLVADKYGKLAILAMNTICMLVFCEFIYVFIYLFSQFSGACVLPSSTEKKDSPSLIEHVVATTANQTAVPLTNQTTRTPRSLEMRLAMNNDIMGDEDLMSYTPNLTSILGRASSTYLAIFSSSKIKKKCNFDYGSLKKSCIKLC